MECQIKSTEVREDTRATRPAVIVVIALLFLVALWAVYTSPVPKAAPWRVATSLTPRASATWAETPIALSARLHSASSKYPLTGLVTFSSYQTGGRLCSAPAAEWVACSYDPPYLPNGRYTYVVTYQGDRHHRPSRSIGVFTFFTPATSTRRDGQNRPTAGAAKLIPRLIGTNPRSGATSSALTPIQRRER
jgi:hypothetical protein